MRWQPMTVVMAIVVVALSAVLTGAQEPDDHDPFDDRPAGERGEAREHREGTGRPLMRSDGTRGPFSRTLSAEEIEERIELLRQLHPELAEQMEKQRKEHPEQVGEMMNRRWAFLGRLMWLRKTDEAGFDLYIQDMKLERQSQDLAHRIAEAHEQGQADQEKELRAELREAVQKHFDVRQKKKEHELAKFEERIAELRKQLATRKDRRDELIDRRVEELLGKKPDF